MIIPLILHNDVTNTPQEDFYHHQQRRYIYKPRLNLKLFMNAYSANDVDGDTRVLPMFFK